MSEYILRGKFDAWYNEQDASLIPSDNLAFLAFVYAAKLKDDEVDIYKKQYLWELEEATRVGDIATRRLEEIEKLNARIAILCGSV
jgi:hypothetical protein